MRVPSHGDASVDGGAVSRPKCPDRLPPFSDAEAFAAIEQDLGVPLEDVFSEISPQSIAAASLGQVYKARLRDGGDIVAVKVQRPNVSQIVGLDLFIIKRIAIVLRRYAKVNSDLGAIVDEWNRSIQGELDYLKEAANGERFRELYGDFPGEPRVAGGVPELRASGPA
eukprot:scaffold149_cov383-Prasinococcus_capsulatus_cf.AAC.15